MSTTPPENIQDSLTKITTEASSLEPSTLINLYEIDISEIKENTMTGNLVMIADDVLRFHNLAFLEGRTLWFQGKQFYSVPIHTEGFELNSSGELSRPKLTLTSKKGLGDDEVAQLASLKRAFRQLGNLVGAKVTRIRTFVKYLDSQNNIEGIGNEPDAYAEFPKEVYYVESKSVEDKNNIQFELASVIDTTNFKLPGRRVFAARCPWTYRGEGCCYEFKGKTTQELDEQKKTFGDTAHLPEFAPPIANADNDLISEEVDNYAPGNVENPSSCTATQGSIKCPHKYNLQATYNRGMVVYVTKRGVKYYFVSKGNTPVDKNTAVPKGMAPPNSLFWEPDQCAKTLAACKLRWGSSGTAKSCIEGSCNANRCGSAECEVSTNKLLPFGGFPGTNTKVSV